MVWGQDLWDQEKLCFSKIDAGLSFSSKCRNFIVARAQLEASYAKDLRKLAQSYLSEEKKPDCGDENTTLQTSWITLLQETRDMAQQHQNLSEQLISSCGDALKHIATDCKSKKKEASSELQKLQKALSASRSKFESSKKAAEKAAKESLDAKDKLETHGPKSSRSKIEKMKQDCNRSQIEAERARDEFEMEQNSYALAQQQFYQEQQAEILNELQQLEKSRIESSKRVFASYVTCHRDVLPFVNVCVDNIMEKVDVVNADSDVVLFATNYKSGTPVPTAESLQTESQVENAPATSQVTVQQINEKRVKKSKFFKTTSRKKDAVREDFGHLPIEQRKKAILKKIADLEDQILKADKSVEGLNKTIELYISQPALGDSKSIAKARKELEETEKKKKSLAGELYRFQLYESALFNKPPPEAPEGWDAGSQSSLSMPDFSDNVSIGSNVSRDRQGSMLSTASGLQSPQLQQRNQSMAQPSQPTQEEFDGFHDSDDDDDDDDFDEFEQEDTHDSGVRGQDDLPRAKALYDFPGSNPGEAALTQGETVVILADDGSGWVRIQNSQQQDGYAPKSYVEIISDTTA